MYSNYIHDDYHQAASAEIELSLNDFAPRIESRSPAVWTNQNPARERDNIACTNTASARSPRARCSAPRQLQEKGKAPKKNDATPQAHDSSQRQLPNQRRVSSSGEVCVDAVFGSFLEVTGSPGAPGGHQSFVVVLAPLLKWSY